MKFVEIILWILQFVLGLGLIFLVLIHSGRGGGLSDMFGGGMTSSLGSSGLAERNLNRFTVVLALVWADRAARGGAGQRGSGPGDDDRADTNDDDNNSGDQNDRVEHTSVQKLWLTVGLTGAVIFLSTPQWWFPHRDELELSWGPVAHLVGNAYLIWGLVFVVLAGARAFRLGRADRGGDPQRPALLDSVFSR